MTGSVVTADAVVSAGLAVLEKWMPSALAEVVRRKTGRPFAEVAEDWPMPRSWQQIPDEGIFALKTDQLPLVAVVSEGLVDGQPERDSDGIYTAAWMLHCVVVVRGQSWDDALRRVSVYAAAARVALAQNSLDLEGARRSRWVGERLNLVNPRKSRSLRGGIVSFRVDTHGAVDDSAGPAVPPAAPEYASPADLIAASAVVETDAL